MISSISIANYRCLKDVTVPLRPLTVLIGQNDSGKTSFLRAIESLGQHDSRFAPADYWRCDLSNEIRIRAEFDDTEVAKCGNERRELNFTGDSNRFRVTHPVRLFQLPAEGIVTEATGFVVGEEHAGITGNGSNLAAMIDYLLRKDRYWFRAVVEKLRELVPGLEDVEISTPTPELRSLDLVVEKGVKIPAAQGSTGLRLMLFFIVLAYQPEPPRVILVEEPENGIHPRRLGDVMRLLRDMTEGRYGKHATQVVLTTHSPYLLDHIDVTRDQVLVFRRCDDGSRIAEPADEHRLQNFLDEFMLGEVWYNQSEAGLVAKPA